MVKKKKATKKKVAKKSTKPKATKVQAQARAPERKLSAIEAAAQILSKAKPKSMNSRELIETMSARGLWESPAGKTPEATLHAAICREIKVKGPESRFVKAGRGKFAAS